METEVSLLANKGVSPPPNAAPGPRSEHDTRQAAVETTPQRQDCHVPGITFRAAHGAAARWTRRRPIPRQPFPLARNTEPAMTRHTRTINTGGHRPRSSPGAPRSRAPRCWRKTTNANPSCSHTRMRRSPILNVKNGRLEALERRQAVTAAELRRLVQPFA